MKYETAKFITDNIAGELYEDYSGRCMYGKTTTGIVVDSVGEFMSEIFGYFAIDIEVMLEDEQSQIKDYTDDLSKMYEVFLQLENELRIDNMGSKIIIY